MTVDDLDPNKCTIYIYAFATLNENSLTMEPFDKHLDIDLKASDFPELGIYLKSPTGADNYSTIRYLGTNLMAKRRKGFSKGVNIVTFADSLCYGSRDIDDFLRKYLYFRNIKTYYTLAETDQKVTSALREIR